MESRLKSPATGLRPAVGLRRPEAQARANARHSVPGEADSRSTHSGRPTGQAVTGMVRFPREIGLHLGRNRPISIGQRPAR